MAINNENQNAVTACISSTGSPLAAINHFSFSLHMIQMSILYFIIPPILLLGIPDYLYKQVWKISIMKTVSKLFPPMISLSVFAVLFLMYHIPITLEILSQYPLIRDGYTLLLFALSLSMWWPITAPDRNQRFCKGRKKRFSFLSGLILMPACLLFIFNALMDGMNNPFLTQAISHLCLPASSSFLLPPLFNTKLDQYSGNDYANDP
ncbi:cytochrome c oxidase assembly protein [Alteribacillus sp. JSM 102045]|uniref:cytochrome c oxidase assembly protein n=1 Tax=Alteribacillus sp. JSM 102045 TaxID=1562101 RepID=UPI0035BFCB8B